MITSDERKNVQLNNENRLKFANELRVKRALVFVNTYEEDYTSITSINVRSCHHLLYGFLKVFYVEWGQFTSHNFETYFYYNLLSTSFKKGARAILICKKENNFI